MLQGTAHHTRHGSNCFEHNGTMAIPTREKSVGEEQQKLDKTVSKPVGSTLRDVVSLERGRIRLT